MYGLPADFDAQMFVGRTLSSATFAENVLHINFDEELTLTVLDSVVYRTSALAEEEVDSPPMSTTSLVSLVGQQVTSGQVANPRELILELDGGGYMRFVDATDMYESFIITVDGKETIV